MPSRVRTIDAVGEDRDRVASCGEGSLVCGTFDPVGTAGDDYSFVGSGGGGQFAGNVVAG